MLQRLILRAVIGEKVAPLCICCLLNFVCWFQGARAASAHQGAGAASARQGAGAASVVGGLVLPIYCPFPLVLELEFSVLDTFINC